MPAPGSSGGGAWTLVSGAARPAFFDAAREGGADSDDDDHGANPRWHLDVAGLTTPLTDEYAADAAERRVTLAAPSGRGVWALRFGDAASFRSFVDEYDARLFKNMYGVADTDAGRAKIYGTDNPLGATRGTGRHETAASAAAWAAPDPVGDDDEDEETTVTATPPRDARVGDGGTDGGVPRALRLGAGDVSYLARGGRVDVLRNVAGGVRPTGTSFTLTPPSAARRGGGGGAVRAAGGGVSDDVLTPGRLLLMRGESRLAALTPDARDRLYDADVETGRVVSEWTFKKDGVEIPVDDIANETRAAQLDDRSTFLGLGANRLVRWDMRTRGGVVGESSPVVEWAGGKDYARGAKFSCLATSGAGCVVVGSADGALRLFSDRSLTRASTALPGLGAPVTAVDVTYDGRWVLATTDRYLMLVKASWADAGGVQRSAFASRLGASAPAPRLLRLKAEDVASLGGAGLAKGRFTWVTEEGVKERWISATCGTATVLWSLDAVKRASPGLVSAGGLTTVTDYHVIRKGESVVDAAFVHGRHGGTPTGTPSSARRRGGAPRTATAADAGMVIVTENAIFSAAAEEDDI